MKKLLINKLLSDDDGDIKTFFDDIEDYSYRDLSINTLIGLLRIKNIKSRYEALESITCNSDLKNRPNYISFILNAFSHVEEPLIADLLKFTCIDENLLNANPIKYETLINKIIEMKKIPRAYALSNIFCNEKVIKLCDEDYSYLLSYAAYALSIEKLEALEEIVFSKETKDIFSECNIKKYLNKQ